MGSFKTMEIVRTKLNWMPVGGTYCAKNKSRAYAPSLLSEHRRGMELCWANLGPGWVSHAYVLSVSPNWCSHCLEFKGKPCNLMTEWMRMWLWELYAYPPETQYVILNVWVCECVCVFVYCICRKVTLQYFSRRVCWCIGFAKESPVIKSNSAALP